MLLFKSLLSRIKHRKHLDVVVLVNIVLGLEEENPAGDLNQDNLYNILDIVQLVNIILG